MAIPTVALLTAATATGAGEAHQPLHASRRAFQLAGSTTSGIGSATAVVEVSLDGINYLTLGTMTIALSITVSTDGFTSDAPWRYVRGNVTAISGTGASVTLTMGA